ncbi:MAG: DNA polymerase III subunit gamma/tau [Lentisphaerae bacterium]|nr:DNA polymerase III subunit gamma/tau [Lentisphaerota bacterium]
MTYQVLARKWRPQTFADIVGQEHISRTLQNAIATQRVGHAYLFVGPRGIGKTTSARVFAKALNCEAGIVKEPCCDCQSCREIAAGSSLDVVEIDGASHNRVEHIRDIRENVQYTPSRSRYKIYIIDEVHMLTTAAWNALLKTLEEPPPHVKFLFATTEPHKVLPTIVSRCQRFDLKRIPVPLIMGRLQQIAEHENVFIEDRALAAIARAADGGMRDAQSIFDQMIAFCGGMSTEEKILENDVIDVFGLASGAELRELAMGLVVNDMDRALRVVQALADHGRDLERLFGDLVGFMRNAMICSFCRDPGSMLEVSDSELDDLRQITEAGDPARIQRLLQELVTQEWSFRAALNKRVHLEATLARVMMDVHSVQIDDIVNRLNQLRGSGEIPAIPIAPSAMTASPLAPAPSAPVPRSAPPSSTVPAAVDPGPSPASAGPSLTGSASPQEPEVSVAIEHPAVVQCAPPAPVAEAPRTDPPPPSSPAPVQVASVSEPAPECQVPVVDDTPAGSPVSSAPSVPPWDTDAPVSSSDPAVAEPAEPSGTAVQEGAETRKEAVPSSVPPTAEPGTPEGQLPELLTPEQTARSQGTEPAPQEDADAVSLADEGGAVELVKPLSAAPEPENASQPRVESPEPVSAPPAALEPVPAPRQAAATPETRMPLRELGNRGDVPTDAPEESEGDPARLWHQLVAEVDKAPGHHQLKLYMQELIPVSFMRGLLQVAYDEDVPEAHAQKLLEPAATEILNRCFQRVSPVPHGRVMIKRWIDSVSNEEQRKQLRSTPELRAKIEQNPFVKEVCTLFSGTVVDVRG